MGVIEDAQLRNDDHVVLMSMGTIPPNISEPTLTCGKTFRHLNFVVLSFKLQQQDLGYPLEGQNEQVWYIRFMATIMTGMLFWGKQLLFFSFVFASKLVPPEKQIATASWVRNVDQGAQLVGHYPFCGWRFTFERFTSLVLANSTLCSDCLVQSPLKLQSFGRLRSETLTGMRSTLRSLAGRTATFRGAAGQCWAVLGHVSWTKTQPNGHLQVENCWIFTRKRCGLNANCGLYLPNQDDTLMQKHEGHF